MKPRLLSRSFTVLWLGQAVSQLGSGVGAVATMWWLQSTAGSALALATLAIVRTSVAVLVGPFAGVIADRFNRKGIMIATDMIRGAIYIVFAFTAYHGRLTLPVLFIGSAISSACAQFFTPAVGATIPLLVPKQEGLERANSLRQLTDQMGSILSYGLGGVLVAVCGIPFLLLIDGISFFIAGGSRFFIKMQRTRDRGRLTAKGVIEDLRAGVGFARADKCLFRLLGVVVMVSFCSVPFCLLLPKLVHERLGAGSAVYGYINSAQMAGMFAGTMLILAAEAPRRYPWLLKWGIGIQSAAFIAAPFLPRRIWAAQLVVYGVFGFFQSIVHISFFTALQREVPQELIGKIYGLVNALNSGAQPLANGLSGYLADGVGITAVFVGAGLLGLLSNLRLLSIPGSLGFLSGNNHHKKSGVAA